MLLPVENVVHHVKSLLFLEFKENNGSDEIHTLAISEFRDGVGDGVKDGTHFGGEMFDDFIVWKSSVQVKLDLLALLLVKVKFVWLDGFHNKLRPYLLPQTIRNALPNIVYQGPFVIFLQLFDPGNQ